ncbi:MAG: tetratricopeptide repeat protein, partial [Anaerolineae bacterium]|nr:tetratricopeptide repeat protein [Anaerolineae bacterium]
IAHVKLLQGILHIHQGQSAHAIEPLQESEALFQRVEDERGMSIALVNQGGAFLEIGDLDASQKSVEKAVDIARTNHDIWGLGLSLSGLGDVRYRQGEVDKAFQHMEEALKLFEQIGQQWLYAEALWRMAEMMQDQGNFQEAQKELERCYSLSRETGAKQWQISALESLGFISLTLELYQQAAGHFLEVLRLTGDRDFHHNSLNVFLGIIQLAAHQNKLEKAATHLGGF